MEAVEQHIKVQRTARYYQLGACGPQTRRIWIVLHGYGQLGQYFIKHFEGLADAETVVVAPEGLSRFYLDGKWDRVGATWMTKEDRLHEIEDYIGYLDGVLAAVTAGLAQMPEIVLLGFSQGTATAWRWLMRGGVQPRSLILWAGGPATDALQSARERLAACDLHFVLGDADEYIKMDGIEAQLDGLRKLKPELQFWAFEGNHRMDAAVLEAIAATLAP